MAESFVNSLTRAVGIVTTVTGGSIGVTTNPLSSKMEDKTKLNWKITWGKIRPKEDED